MAIILGITDIIKVTEEHTYNVELGHVAVEREKGNASVKMGGSDPAKFVPNINASKWDDESFLNINYPGSVVSAERETFISDKVELSVGGLIHRYFKKNDRDLKYDVVIPTKPLSNHFVFNLKFSENLKFIHQGTAKEEWLIQSQNDTVPVFGKTTLEEFEKIFNRPDNIINSYAVYGYSKNNKYLTGKFCHIERVKFIDARGDEIWAEQLIEVTERGIATWTITVDQAWLDGAAYPIVIDPVFGYNTIGGSSVEPGATFFGGIFATPTTGGTIDDIQIYAEKTGGNPYLIMGLYEDSGSGDLDLQDLLSANSVAKILPSQPAWVQDTAITGNVVGGTYEWLATETMNGWEVYFDTGVGLEEARYTSVTYDGVLPDPAPDSLGYYNAELSFYINFTESSVGEDYIKSTLSSINLIGSNKKPMAFKRPTLETVDLNELLKRLIDRKRLFQENVDLKDSNKRAFTFKRMVIGTVDLFDSIKDKLSTKLTEIIMETVNLIDSIKNPFVFKRPVYALVNLNGSNKRSIDFKRLLFSTVDFVSSDKRAFSFTRGLYGQESINDSNKRIKGLKKFIYDAIDILASVKDQLVAGGEAFIKIFLESLDIADLSKRQVTYKRIASSTVDLIASIKRNIIFKRFSQDTIDLISIIKRAITFKRPLYAKENIYDSNKKVSIIKRILLSVVDIIASLKYKTSTSIKKIILEAVNISDSLKSTISTVIKKIILDSITLIESSIRKIAFFKSLYGLLGINESLKRTITLKRIILSVVSFISLPFRKITYKRMLLSVIDLKESLFAKKTILRIIQESLNISSSILGTIAVIPAAVVFYKIYKFLYNTVFHSFKVDRTIRQFEKPDDISKMKRGG